MSTARLAAFTAVVLWGISFAATKALGELSPVTLIFTRFALGTAVLFLILTFRRQSLTPPRDAWPMAVMGFVGIFVHQMVQAHALTLTTASWASSRCWGESVAVSTIVSGRLVLGGALIVQTANRETPAPVQGRTSEWR